MDGISGVSSGFSSFQVNTAPAVSVNDIQEQESIFAKKGGGGGQIDPHSSIFSQYNSEENITSSVSTDTSATAM